MRRWLCGFTVVILILVAAMPPATLAFLNNVPPHEDPERAERAVDALYLLALYCNVLEYIGEVKLDNATSMLKLIEGIEVPRNVRYVIDRTNQLLNKLSSELNETENRIEEARILIDNGFYEEALSELNRALICLARANATLDELPVELIQGLGKFVPKDYEERLREISDRISELVDRIRDLIEEILEEMRNLRMRVTGRIPTFIMVNATPQTLMVGGNLTIHGFLYDVNGTPLNGRLVKIFFELSTPGGESIIEPIQVYTRLGGAFKFTVRMPYIYREESMTQGVIVRACYTPSGGDVSIYSASTNYTKILLLFNRTIVTISAPEEVLPGKNVSVSISVDPWINVSRKIHVFFDSRKVLGTTLNNRTITSTIKIPASTGPGKHFFRVVVEPYETFSPGENSTSVTVVLEETFLKVSVKDLVLYPFESKVLLEGFVVDENGSGLENALIRVFFQGREYAVNSSRDGYFNVSFNVGFSIVFSRSTLTVLADPVEPWMSSASWSHTITTVNVLSVFFILSVILLAFMNASRLRRVGERVFERFTWISVRGSRGEVTGGKIPVGIGEATGLLRGYTVRRGPIVEYYLRVVEKISRIVGRPKPYETIREYLWRAKNALPQSVLRLFEKLSFLAEKAIYSPTGCSSEDVSSAESIARRILESDFG